MKLLFIFCLFITSQLLSQDFSVERTVQGNKLFHPKFSGLNHSSKSVEVLYSNKKELTIDEQGNYSNIDFSDDFVIETELAFLSGAKFTISYKIGDTYFDIEGTLLEGGIYLGIDQPSKFKINAEDYQLGKRFKLKITYSKDLVQLYFNDQQVDKKTITFSQGAYASYFCNTKNITFYSYNFQGHKLRSQKEKEQQQKQIEEQKKQAKIDLINANYNKLIQENLSAWSMKNDFETTNQYKKRTSKKNLEAKANELLENIINQEKQETLDSIKYTIVSRKYSADDETFKLTLNTKENIYLSVPLGDAKKFQKSQLIIKPQLSLNENYAYFLSSAQVTSATLGAFKKSYEWHNKTKYQQISFDSANKKSEDYQIKTKSYDSVYGYLKLTLKNGEIIFAQIPKYEIQDVNNSTIHISPSLGVNNQNGKIIINSAQIEIYQKSDLDPVTYHWKSSNTHAFNPSDLKSTIDLSGIETTITTQHNQVPLKQNKITPSTPDVDLNIPKTGMSNPNGVAVVIGNSNYKYTKNVDYAVNDAKTMKKYLINTLGYQEGNIIYLENASNSELEVVFGNENGPSGKLQDWIKPGVSDVFIFYSGHGAPSLKNNKGYFVPSNGDPKYIENSCYLADVFYSNLAQLDAKSITVVIDACFSGADLFENISPIVVKANTSQSTIKNGLVFTSSSGDEVSSWYNEKGHGMFTYFFLKAMHYKNADANKDGLLTAQEIQTYISNHAEGVPYYSKRLHGVQQTPQLKGMNKDKVLVTY